MFEATHAQATLTKDQIGVEVKETGQTYKLSWNPLRNIDWVATKNLNYLLTANGFRGNFFKVVKRGWFTKILIFFFDWSILALIIATIIGIAVVDPQALIICTLIDIFFFLHIYIMLTYGLIVWLQNRNLANAIFRLLCFKQDTETMTAFNMVNKLFRVTFTKREIGVKFEALKLALKTDSEDAEVNIGKVSAGVLGEEKVEIEVMWYGCKYLYQCYYCIVWMYIFYSALLAELIYVHVNAMITHDFSLDQLFQYVKTNI